MAINRSQFTRRIGPFVPDGDAMLLQPAHIGFALQEPQKLVDDRLGEQLLGGQKRKTLCQIEAHLMAEDGARAGAGPVALFHARLQHAIHKLQILAHEAFLCCKSNDSEGSLPHLCLLQGIVDPALPAGSGSAEPLHHIAVKP